MKKLILVLMICLTMLMFSAQKELNWSGKWMLSYHAYFNEGWTFQIIEFSENGNMYEHVGDRRKVVGQWRVEEIIPKGSPLTYRLLKFEIWENEYAVLYNHIEKYHAGRGLVSDGKSNWNMNPIKFEMKKVNK